MSEHNTEKLQKQLKIYQVIFIGLIILTVATAAISRLELTTSVKIAIALAIAFIQAAFSVSYFMHLNTEKVSIRWFLILTAFFFLTLLSLPVLTNLDHIKY